MCANVPSRHFDLFTTQLVTFWYSAVNSLLTRRHAICPMSINIPPFGPPRLPFIAAFFSLSPPTPTSLVPSSSCPSLPLSVSHFHFYSPTTKNVAPKAISHFLRKQARNAQRKQASPAWIIYVSIPPGGIYLAQTKEGYWCVLEEKKRAL